MARLIGSSNTDNFGENFFVSKAIEYMDNSHIIYWNRQLHGCEFDVCILIPNKGILVVELKGWREENILRIDNNEKIAVKTDDGEILASPQKQARAYRFSLDRYIRKNINKFPLVFQMVGLPQVSKEFFRSKRLNVVLEEGFTFLKEDLENAASFFAKLDQALREVCNWKRDCFDERTMLEVRNLFETDIDLSTNQPEPIPDADLSNFRYRQHDYSRFYYFAESKDLTEQILTDMEREYFSGCKLYCVFPDTTSRKTVVDVLEKGLSARGLVRNREDIFVSFDKADEMLPVVSNSSDTFIAFHCSFSVSVASIPGLKSFFIRDGQITNEQRKALDAIADCSQFNKEQYLVEHADPDKNIVIRAGAGTGKTYTMISRIGYICYCQNVPIQKMIDRIVMITFTNEAADQMGEKIKRYFRNLYLITGNSDYLQMVSGIDQMQISTIHAYAKSIIAQLGTAFGYGTDLSITSSEFYRRKKITDILDAYIGQKKKEHGDVYIDNLGMPVYAIRDTILDFIEKLHNKSVDIVSINADDFGNVIGSDGHKELHELLASVIPDVERAYFSELLENNKIHLGSMMSTLNRFINESSNEARIKALKRDKGAPYFMFVDEFQDTDDSQIESLMKIAQLLEYRLFLVGDIKQCIYRFRGAEEKAFDKLNTDAAPEKWLDFSLRQNYRTDKYLLDIFHRSFSSWGARDEHLLSYKETSDRLIGTKSYNGYLQSDKQKFYHHLTVSDEDMRIRALIGEIKRLQLRIRYEIEKRGQKLSSKEKTIAILVRENWQADMVRMECGKLGITVQTNTGGDLYMSQPALDMLTLLNALVHFDEADHLYNLISSNFFSLDIPKSNLYEIRMKIRKDGWRAKADEREQVDYLIRFMNLELANTNNKENKWEYIVASFRTQPVLQAIRKIYDTLEPWKHYSDDPWKQHYYQLNVDLLFEQIINACNVDKLTINTMRDYLYNSIVSRTSVDSRIPSVDKDDALIQCITVHKSKGLEYGYVIMPFCSASIDYIKRSQLHVSASKTDSGYCIGYSMSAGETGGSIQNDYYNERIEKSEKAREETRILYVAMTRAICSFSWIEVEGKQSLSWQNLIEAEV